MRALSGGGVAGWGEFGDLYRGEAARLAVFGITLGADRDRAADLAQESLAALWGRWHDVPGTPRTFARILAVRAARQPSPAIPQTAVAVDDAVQAVGPQTVGPQIGDAPEPGVEQSDATPLPDDPQAGSSAATTPDPDSQDSDSQDSDSQDSDSQDSDSQESDGHDHGYPLRFPTSRLHEAVLAGLALLPAHEQQVLVATFDDLPPEDVAQVLQMRVDAVGPTADAARAALESNLDGRSARPAYEALVADIAAGMDLEAGLALVAAAEPGTARPTEPPRRNAPQIPDELVRAAMTGDRAAVARLLEMLRPLVARYCRGKLGPVDRSFVSADDVAQEVCLAVLGALPNYRLQGRPFLAFVYGIASHKVIDAHRAVSRGRTDPVADVPESVSTDAGPEQQALRGALSTQLRALLDELPEKQREILVLRIVVGLSADETAQIVGASPGAVRVAQHRALARLRKDAPRSLVQDQP